MTKFLQILKCASTYAFQNKEQEADYDETDSDDDIFFLHSSETSTLNSISQSHTAMEITHSTSVTTFPVISLDNAFLATTTLITAMEENIDDSDDTATMDILP